MREGDAFKILSEEQAGALAGALLAFAIICFDWMPRFLDWLTR